MKSVHLPQRFYSGMPNGTTCIDIGGLQIQRSFSGSSCGSNGSVYSSSNVNAPLRYPGAEIVFLHLLRLLMPEVFQLPLSFLLCSWNISLLTRLRGLIKI